MSGGGAPLVAPVEAGALTLGIVAATWHAELTDQLLARAVEAAKACGVAEPHGASPCAGAPYGPPTGGPP